MNPPKAAAQSLFNALCWALFFVITKASAQTPDPASSKSPRPLWEVGAGGILVSQQAYPGSSTQIKRGLALRLFLYRGEFLRTDRGGISLKAASSPSWELDLSGAAAFGSNASQVPLRLGMPDIGTLVELGPRLRWYANPVTKSEWRVELPVRGVFNLSNSFKDEGLVFEPQVVYEKSRDSNFSPWQWQASLGPIYGDKRLAQMFYGVNANQATSNRAAFQAEAGLITWRLKTSTSYAINKDLRIFGLLQLNSTQGAANAASPLMDRTNGMTAGIGLTYILGRSSEMVNR